MDDLISRSALLKEIDETAEAVEEQNVFEDIKKAFLDALAVVREHVVNISTAHKDKVEEENKQIKQAIYKASQDIQEIVDYPHEFMSCAQFFPKLREIQDELVGSIEDRQVE